MKRNGTTRANRRGPSATLAAGFVLGAVLAPVGAWTASATEGCATDEAALTAAALGGDAGGDEALRAAAADGLTAGEVSGLGFTTECRSGTLFFVAVTPPTPESPAPSAVPSEIPASSSPSAVPSPVASATAQAAVPQTVVPQSTATGSSRAASKPTPSAAPSPSATADAPAAVAAAEPIASSRAFDGSQLETFAARGASPQDQRVASEALGASRLTSSRADLPGIGVIAGLSASAAILLGGAAAVVGRGGDRRPRHSR